MKQPEVIKIRKRQSIEKLKVEVEELETNLRQLKNRKYELQDKIEFIEDTNIDVKKIITYFSFSDNRKLLKPFKNNDGLIKELKKKFGDKLKELTETLFYQRNIECNLIKVTFGINKLSPITISGETLYVLDPSTDWEFIEKNYMQIEWVKKEDIEYSNVKKITTVPFKKEHELIHYRYNRTTLLLMDLSAKIEENENKDSKLKEEINQLESSIEVIIEEIRSKETKKFIEEYCHLKVVPLKRKLEEENSKQLELDSNLFAKKQELKNLNQ